MTNFERWQSYCKDLPSPQSYIDFGFYFMIAAALQRRVWVGAEHDKLHLNQYVIFAGPPGNGKGRIISPVKEFLCYNKAYKQEGIEDASDLFTKTNKDFPGGKSMYEASPIQFNHSYHQEAGETNMRKKIDAPILFPIAPDSTTFQMLIKAFVDSMAGGFIKDAEGNPRPFWYCSLFMCLEELSSIFRKQSEDVARLLLNLYDCKDYEYETLSRQKDKIRNGCLNILAGTTPKFIRWAAKEDLLGEGFNSRAWFIYEPGPRFYSLLSPPLSIEQKTHKAELIIHLRLLSKVKGNAFFSQEASNWLCKWWQSFGRSMKANSNPKLVDYYSRKQAHVMKLAGAVHFAEIQNPEDMTISLSSVKKAFGMLESVETRMHMALCYRSENPLADVGENVCEILEKKKEWVSFNDIHSLVWDKVKKYELEEVLSFLMSNKRIISEPGKGFKIKMQEL